MSPAAAFRAVSAFVPPTFVARTIPKSCFGRSMIMARFRLFDPVWVRNGSRANGSVGAPGEAGVFQPVEVRSR